MRCRVRIPPPPYTPPPIGAPMPYVAFDTETHLIARGRLAPRPVCLSLGYRGGLFDEWPESLRYHAIHRGGLEINTSLVTGVSAMIDVFGALLADPEVTLIGQNTAYDLAVLADAASLRGIDLMPGIFAALDAGRIRDTKIREMLLAIAQNRIGYDPITKKAAGIFSLSNLVLRYFKVDISASKSGGEPWRLRYCELDGTPAAHWPGDAAAYALDDAQWTLSVYEAQWAANPAHSDIGKPVVLDNGDIVDEIPQTAAAWALHLMACYGLRTDPDAVRAFTEDTAAIVADGEAAAIRAGFLRPPDKNGHRARNMKVLRALVSAAYHEKPPLSKPSKTYPNGQVKTDADTLEGSGHPDLIGYAEAGTARKFAETYIPILERAGEYPLTSSPNVLVKSGRTSWRKPNMQNPPRKGRFRECFVPRPGNLFVSVDYDTAELRALAQVLLWWFGESALARAICDGIDPHLDFAADFLGISYKKAKKRYRKGDAEVDHARTICKHANFGFAGGLGVNTFVAMVRGFGVEVDQTTAQNLKNGFFRKWPEMRQYFEVIGNASQMGTFTQTQPVSGRQRGGCTFTSGANTIFQGLVADIAKSAMVDLARVCYAGEGPLRGVRPVLFLHDEIIAEGPAETVTAWGDAMAEIMVAAGVRYCPDIPWSASPAAMPRWYKKAKELRSPSGGLIPWTP